MASDSAQLKAISKGFDTFARDVKQLQYHETDKQLKATARKIQSQLPKQASAETLDSFKNYRYSNNGASRKLKFQISTKKSNKRYRFTANLGKNQNLAHLFQDGFELKQRHGFTHVKSIMNISFESESNLVANRVVAYMNRQKGE